MKRIFFLSLIGCFLFAVDAVAGKRWWISTTTSNWNNTGNWSSVSATGASGAAVPGTSDTVYFTSSRTGQCTLDVAASIKRWEMGSGCGTFSQGTYSLTVGTSGAVLSGGTFTGGSGTITFSGACTISGTAFTSTSGIFSTNSNFSLNSGSFADNGGTMKFTASCTITAATSMTLTMDTLEFNPSAHAGYTISGAGTMNVSKLLRYANSNQIAVSSGTINVQGDISLNNTFSGNSAGGTATININGTGAQYINGTTVTGQSRLPSITINKSSDTLFLVKSISTQGANFTYTNGIVDAGNSTFWFAGNKTFSGSITLNIVAFGASVSSTYTINAGTVITADSTLQIVGSTNAIFNTGTIHAHDHISVTNTATGGGGTASLVINGSVPQTLTGSGTAGQGRLPHVTIDKSSGTLTLVSVISCTGNWTYTGIGSGSINPGTSTVAFYGTANLDGQQAGSAAMMPFNNVSINGGTSTLTGNLDVNGNFTIASGATCSAGSNTMYVGGDWNSTGTWTYGTSTVVFDGSGYNKVQGAGTGTVNFATVQLSRNNPGTGGARNLRLLNPVLINTSMTFNRGRVYCTTTNYLAFADNATCTVSNDDSAYVHGPVRKTGNDAFSFPLGDTTLHDSIAYHPLAITAPSDPAHRFEAIYSAKNQSYGTSKQDTLVSISNCEYWTLERQVGSSNVGVSVSWNKNSCNVDNYDDLRLAGWNGSQWQDLGNVTVTVSEETGSITMSGTTAAFPVNPYPILIGKGKNTTPYAVLQTELTGGYHMVSNGKLLFKYDELYNETGDLRYTLYDDYHRPVASNTISPGVLTTDDVVTGDNRYLLNLLDCDITPNGSLGSGMYLLEVENDKHEKRYLLIKHTATITPLCPGSNPQ